MRFRFRSWQVVLAVLLVCAAVLAVLESRRRAYDVSTAALVARLPGTNVVKLALDVQALRRAGVLSLLAGDRADQEPDYRRFVQATGFDYIEDLDTISASFVGEDSFFVLRGRFDWPMLHDYTLASGGGCRNAFCSISLDRPNFYASFYPLVSGVIAFAVSSSPEGAYRILGFNQTPPPFSAPDLPFWIAMPGPVLRSSQSLPEGTRSFVSAVSDAEQVVLGLAPSGLALEAVLEARCASPEQAAESAARLRQVTELLASFIRRANQTPNPSDLSGVLTAGSFEARGNLVLGRWPVERQFLLSLTAGN